MVATNPLAHGAHGHHPSDSEPYMSDAQLAQFRKVLIDWKDSLLDDVGRTVTHMKDESGSFPDPNDRATQEEEFSIELRTRDRAVSYTHLDDVITVDGAIHRRIALERLDHRLDEKAHEAKSHPVFLLEVVLIAIAQIHDRLHVDFIERRQHGRAVFGHQQPLGDAGAQPRHRHPLLQPAETIGRQRGTGGRHDRSRPGRC